MSELRDLGIGAVGSFLNNTVTGLSSAMFGNLQNRRARSLYRFQKQQDLAYQKELSEYLTTNQSKWQKQALRAAGLSTASLGGDTTLAGTSLGSGSLQGQPIDTGSFDIGSIVSNLADAQRARSQADLFDKQVEWFDRQAQTDIDLKSSQTGYNDEARKVQIALTQKYGAETLNLRADRQRIEKTSEMTGELLRSMINQNDASSKKLLAEAQTYNERLPYIAPLAMAQLRLWESQSNASVAQAMNLRAAISLMAAQADFYGASSNRLRTLTPLEAKKMITDTANVLQNIQNARTDQQLTEARIGYQQLMNKYYVRNMRWNHASQTFGMIRDLGIGVGSVMTGVGSLRSGSASMSNAALNWNLHNSFPSNYTPSFLPAP